MKICTKCDIEKPYSEFHRFIYSKDGYKNICKKCIKLKSKEYRQSNKEVISKKLKIWREENKESVKEKKKHYYEKNKEKILSNNKIWRDNNKDKIKNTNIKYYENNKEKINFYKKEYRNKEFSKENMKEWRKNNQDKIRDYRKKYLKTEGCKKDRMNWYYKMKKENPHILAWRKVLTNSLKRLDTKKSSSTIEMLGYSAEDLKLHLETLFDDGMNWGNYGEWHIDHKKPVSLFDKNTDASIVNELNNLQPLWKLENLSKGNRYNK